MYEFDLNQTYRLIDVRDLDGNTKVHERSLYRDRIGCVAQNIRKKMCTYNGARFDVLKMDFVQDSDGRWISRHLRTSAVSDILDKGYQIEVYTQNSIYVLEPARLIPPTYQQASDLIELYLSDEGERFCKGFYYDETGKPHELACWVHLGMFVDSCLVFPVEDRMMSTAVCRYYLQSDSVEFYDTLYHQQEYNTPILIHNQSAEPMCVQFEFFDAVWVIPPWGEETIVPYSRDSADRQRKY